MLIRVAQKIFPCCSLFFMSPLSLYKKFCGYNRKKCTISAFSSSLYQRAGYYTTKNALLSTKTKVRFLNDVCLRQMMLAAPMMTATPNDVCLTAHLGKHRIIATKRSNIIFAKQMHHIAARRCIIRRYTRLAP